MLLLLRVITLTVLFGLMFILSPIIGLVLASILIIEKMHQSP